MKDLRGERFHFLGIAGQAMRGVAVSVKELGAEVSGTDPDAYSGVDWLEERGITCWADADPSHLRGVTRLIISGHIGQDNLELAEANKLGVKVISFPELLSELIAPARRIVVSGTHGKTTITGLLIWTYEQAGQTPDYLIGMQPKGLEASCRIKGSKVAILEGDEYRASQLDPTSKLEYYHPDVLVLTTIEYDHPDLFASLEEILSRFVRVARGMTKEGRIHYWRDSETARSVATSTLAPSVSYDLALADFSLSDLQFLPDGLHFTLVHKGTHLGPINLPLYGVHNALNALAAASVAVQEGIGFETLAAALASFPGVNRRLDRLSPPASPITVFDDYAHHPTEASATIGALKQHFPGRLIAIYQPHTYSRTRALLREYRTAFNEADLAYILPIESARENGQEASVSSDDIVSGAHGQVKSAADSASLLAEITKVAQPGDTILCMSVNGMEGLPMRLAQALSSQPQSDNIPHS